VTQTPSTKAKTIGD